MDELELVANNEYPVISVPKTIFEKALEDDLYKCDALCSESPCWNLQNQDYINNMKELHIYLDTVRKIARPGGSQEVLNVALSSLASLVKTLSILSSEHRLLASL